MEVLHTLISGQLGSNELDVSFVWPLINLQPSVVVFLHKKKKICLERQVDNHISSSLGNQRKSFFYSLKKKKKTQLLLSGRGAGARDSLSLAHRQKVTRLGHPLEEYHASVSSVGYNGKSHIYHQSCRGVICIIHLNPAGP